MKFLKALPKLVGFAPIDLKDAIIRLKDGFSNGDSSPTVAGTENIGDTVIELTQSSMETTVPVGAHVMFEGDDTKYVVTARTINAAGEDEVQNLGEIASTSGNWTLTITLPGNDPVVTGNLGFAITAAALQTAVDLALAGLIVDGVTYTAGDVVVTGTDINSAGGLTLTFSGNSVEKRDIAMVVATDVDLDDMTPPVETETNKGVPAGSTESITVDPPLVTALAALDDVTFLPIELEIKIGEGNFTYDENREIEFIRDRGILDTYRLGDEQPMDVSFDFTWEFITAIAGADTPTIEEALKRTNAAATWTSTNPDACAAYCVDIEIVNAPDCGDILAEVIELPMFLYTQLSHDTDAAQVSVTGQCNATEAVITRTDSY